MRSIDESRLQYISLLFHALVGTLPVTVDRVTVSFSHSSSTVCIHILHVKANCKDLGNVCFNKTKTRRRESFHGSAVGTSAHLSQREREREKYLQNSFQVNISTQIVSMETTTNCSLGFVCDSGGSNPINCTIIRQRFIDEGLGDILAGAYCPENTSSLLNCPVGHYCPDPVRFECGCVCVLVHARWTFPYMHIYDQSANR